MRDSSIFLLALLAGGAIGGDAFPRAGAAPPGLPAPAADNQQTNLIENGGFEQGEPKQPPPPGWAIWGDAKDKLVERFAQDPANPKSGKYAIRIEHPAGTHAFLVSDPKRPIKTQPGKAYILSFWSRTANLKELGVVYWETKGGSSPARWPIPPSTDWTSHRFEMHEGVDFFSSETKEIMLAFRPTRSDDASQTLWIDDIVVHEIPSTEPRLIDEHDLHYPPLNHRLRPGQSLEITVDAQERLGEAVREAAGQSFHRLAGYGRHPYDLASGRFVLEPELVNAIRECRLPMTRFYATGVEPWPIDQTLDRLADLMDRVGIPRRWTVLELEPQDAGRTLPPEFWAGAARYSVEKGHGFHLWEISNEPYTRKATAFREPDDYIKHVIACSNALHAVQPDAQVGMAINSESQGWGNYVLKQAAGHYDFVVGHYYASAQGKSLEEVALGTNYRMLDRIRAVNALIAAYNTGRAVYQLDTEWGLTDAAVEGRPETAWRNNNLFAAMHRAVRLIYYARERLVRGASGWEMFTRVRNQETPGLAFLTRDYPQKEFMNYWVCYFFNRHCGKYALDLSGTAPWYRPGDEDIAAGSGPVTPVLATLDEDGRTLFFVIANASWGNAWPATIHWKHFKAVRASGTVLSQDDPNGVGLVTGQEVTRELPLEVAKEGLRFTLPGHSIVFLRVSQSEASTSRDPGMPASSGIRQPIVQLAH